MFVVVRYGDGQQHIFNPNCPTSTLLKSIREKCRYGDEAADIELSDESGNVKYLRDAHNRYACEMLDERETLVLLRVDGTESPCLRYTPLLKDDDAITEDFLARLVVKDEPLSRPQSWRKNRTRGQQGEKDKNSKDKVHREKQKSGKPEKHLVRSRSRQSRE